MKTALKPLLIAGLLAVAGLTSYAQTPPSPSTQTRMMDHGMDPAQREARMAQHLAALKPLLKLTSAQEGAWTTFTTAMAPAPRAEPKRPDRADMDKLTTPERIDKMHAMQTQRMSRMSATMERHGAAIKAFYNELSADQKKIFDTKYGKMMQTRQHMKHQAAGAATPPVQATPPATK